ncbi:MAG: tetratricopeptide repeat protein [Myxococcota bacterium]
MEERFVRTGRPLEIGNDPILPIPVPEGAPYVARVLWTTRSACAVKDAEGGVHELGPGRPLTLTHGPVQLTLYLVEQVWLPRLGKFSIAGSLAWFAVVLMFTTLVVQSAWIVEQRCQIAFSLISGAPDVGEPLLWAIAPAVGLGVALVALLLADQPRRALGAFALPVAALALPVAYHFGGFTWKSGDQFIADELAQCLPPPGGEGGGEALSAEYLARLLRNDLEGEDRGVIENDIERPDAERQQDKQVFMPAGSAGPATKMGGAEQVAPTPIRTLVEDALAAPPIDRQSTDPLPSDAGRPIRAEDQPDPQDGVADGMEVDPTEDPGDAQDAPAEEHEGWGFPEWYDERDKAMDDLEITMMLRHAQHRLRIDPDDAAALSILSYYQYLAQDYAAAKKTYDRYIELFPDDAAGYNNKALVYKREGEYQKEEALYRVALSLEPNDETALNNLGVNLAHQQRFDEALAVMKDLEVIDPADAYADLHRSKIYAEMRDDERALAFLEKALEGMNRLDTLHHIEFRQDIRIDPSFERLRETYRFRAILNKYYGNDSPLEE